MKRISTSCVAVTAVLASMLTSGCSIFNPLSLPVGASSADVRGSLGEPTGTYPSPSGGQRLEYARGPYGKHTWMLDFDARGALLSTTQVLTEARFNAVRAGMSRDELRFDLGRPSEQSSLALQRQTVWSYRYEGPFCQWFQVGFDAGGRVVDSGYYPDPQCEVVNESAS